MYGQLGVLAYDAVEDKVECHICGQWFRGLNNHVLRTHGLTVDEYRMEFGLNRGQGLICEGTKQRLRELNLKMGNWKHLASQTMPKAELLEFLRSIAPERPVRLRPQACLLKSELLRAYNPMNEPEAQERAVATLQQTWYGSPTMIDLSRRNLMATIEKRRQKSLEERRYSCPCGKAFATRKEGEHHRAKCPVARQRVIQKQQKARQQWWEHISPELKEQYRKRMREIRKLRKTWPKRRRQSLD